MNRSRILAFQAILMVVFGLANATFILGATSNFLFFVSVEMVVNITVFILAALPTLALSVATSVGTSFFYHFLRFLGMSLQMIVLPSLMAALGSIIIVLPYVNPGDPVATQVTLIAIIITAVVLCAIWAAVGLGFVAAKVISLRS